MVKASESRSEFLRRVEAVLTVYRAEMGIEISPTWIESEEPAAHADPDSGRLPDTEDGSLAWWCARNAWVLERHGLWMQHPAATVVQSWQEDDPPFVHLQRMPSPTGERCYFPDAVTAAAWRELQARGGYAGMTRRAWKDFEGRAEIAKPSSPSSRARD